LDIAFFNQSSSFKELNIFSKESFANTTLSAGFIRPIKINILFYL